MGSDTYIKHLRLANMSLTQFMVPKFEQTITFLFVLNLVMVKHFLLPMRIKSVI